MRLAILCLIFPALLACDSGCGGAAVKADVKQVWDCLQPDRAKIVAQLEPLGIQLLEKAIALALHNEATIDVQPMLDALVDAGKDAVPCVVATVFARRETAPIYPVPTLVSKGLRQPIDPRPKVREAFERLRTQRFGGASFVTVVGPI